MNEVDALLHELRDNGWLESIGFQDPEVGFPKDSPPGFWVAVYTQSGYTSHCGPDFSDCLLRAVKDARMTWTGKVTRD